MRVFSATGERLAIVVAVAQSAGNGGSGPYTARALTVRWWPVCAALGVSLLGCEGSPAQARAVWIDTSARTEDGATLHIYDRGDLKEVEFQPLDPDTGIGLAPGGRGVVLRGDLLLWFLDLDEGRQLLMDVPDKVKDDEVVDLSGPGDAVFWIENSDLALVPLDGLPPALDDRGFVQPLTWRRTGSTPAVPTVDWAVGGGPRSLVFAYTVGAEPEVVSVLRYPALEHPELTRVERVAASAPVGNLGRPRDPDLVCAARLSSCGTDFAVDPEGRTVSIVRQEQLLRWAWDEDPGFVTLNLPPELAVEDDASLLRPSVRLAAAVAPDTYLFFKDESAGNGLPTAPEVIRWRIGGPPERLPALGTPPFSWAMAADGRALTLASRAGPAVRVSGDGFEVLNTSRTVCDAVANRSPVFSPDGRQVAWVCRDPNEEFVDGSVVVRVAPGRLETFLGIPFVVLAIDDEGNVLMHSEQALSEDADGVDPSFVPRTLYVLGNDEVLRRADDLEPVPTSHQVFRSTSQSAFLQGAAL